MSVYPLLLVLLLFGIQSPLGNADQRWIIDHQTWDVVIPLLRPEVSIWQPPDPAEASVGDQELRCCNTKLQSTWTSNFRRCVSKRIPRSFNLERPTDRTARKLNWDREKESVKKNTRSREIWEGETQTSGQLGGGKRRQTRTWCGTVERWRQWYQKREDDQSSIERSHPTLIWKAEEGRKNIDGMTNDVDLWASFLKAQGGKGEIYSKTEVQFSLLEVLPTAGTRFEVDG